MVLGGRADVTVNALTLTLSRGERGSTEPLPLREGKAGESLPREKVIAAARFTNTA
jgi:hypothetical protein